MSFFAKIWAFYNPEQPLPEFQAATPDPDIPTMPGAEDVLIWPCGTWCHRYQLAEHSHLSGDYEVLKADTRACDAFLNDPDVFLAR